MKIFLDARDLINLLEGRGQCTVDDFRERLQRGSHTLVLSPTVIFEISAPLSHPSSNTVVTKLLNDLESLPHVFINDAQIQPKEIRSAIDSYIAGSEYVTIDTPYVSRLDAAIPISGTAPTAHYLNHGLAETVFTMWQGDKQLFRWNEGQVNSYQSVMAMDRNFPTPPTLAQHFGEKLRRDLNLYEIPHPYGGLDAFANWVYQTPTRCPAVRLGYEVYHQIRRNITDQRTASDFGDFAHLSNLPYVDRMTLDRGMADYVQRATKGWKGDLPGTVRHDLDSILREL